jgi:undecaprenyl diphosphate synthase
MAQSKSLVPKHLGIILDGNRRWAEGKGLPSLEGHQQGAEVLKAVALAAFDRGVRYISAYAFSTENWQRTEEEVGYLMRLFMKAVELHLDTFDKAGIRVVILGRRDGLSSSVVKAFDKTEEKTKNNTRGTLALCVNYGGQEELVDATRKLIASGVAASDIDRQMVKGALYHPEIPGVDLLVRTSGEKRTSGFMLYRSDYAELYFTDVLWPDFNQAELDKALGEYVQRKRRFGK